LTFFDQVIRGKLILLILYLSFIGTFIALSIAYGTFIKLGINSIIRYYSPQLSDPLY